MWEFCFLKSENCLQIHTILFCLVSYQWEYNSKLEIILPLNFEGMFFSLLVSSIVFRKSAGF